jgi:hypothetical protein
MALIYTVWVCKIPNIAPQVKLRIQHAMGNKNIKHYWERKQIYYGWIT